MLLLLAAPCSLSQTVNEDGLILSDASDLKAGDRIILPDGAMYAMVQKDELTARLDEILPEISLGEIPKKLYRYKRIGVYGTDMDTKDIRDALAQYGCVSLSREEGLTSEQKAQKLSYSGASLLMEVKSVPGSEIRLRALRTVSQREAVLLGRLAMSKGSIDCLIIQNPPAGQTALYGPFFGPEADIPKPAQKLSAPASAQGRFNHKKAFGRKALMPFIPFVKIYRRREISLSALSA